MKLIALAAALAMTGTVAVAQDTASPPTSQEPATSAAAPAPDAAAAPAGEDPAGGYQPSAPALSAQPQPGQQVIFQPSKSPAEAYPPPAPLQSYPICKKGQFDNCRQRGG